MAGSREVVEADAEAGGVGEVGVVLAGAGEVGEELDLLADGDGDEEGRVFVGEGAGVGLGLAAGADHGVVPRGAGGAARGAAGRRGSWARRGGAALGFEDEVAALVEVDAAGGAGAREGHRVLEAVAVGVGGVGAVGADQGDEVDEEGLRGGELAGVGEAPAGDEGFGVGGGGMGRG